MDLSLGSRVTIKDSAPNSSFIEPRHLGQTGIVISFKDDWVLGDFEPGFSLSLVGIYLKKVGEIVHADPRDIAPTEEA